VALISSSGRLEIAVREGSAARELGAGPGEPVRIRPL
jgi:S-adenosylmethionine hydrolase